MAKWIQGTVVDNIHWTENLFSLKIDADVDNFSAGQFTSLALDIGGKRIAQGFQYLMDLPGKLMTALGLTPMINDFLDFFGQIWFGFKKMLSGIFGILGMLPEKLGKVFDWINTHTVDDIVDKFKEWG